MSKGKIYVVGIGPGNIENMTIKAYNILKKVDVIVGYTTYVNLIKEEFSDKEFYISGMKKEIERCEKVLELAREGKTVALISSGDAGIYGMAGIMLEVAQKGDYEVEIIPGMTSVLAGASLVGAPLMHDNAIVSLSDLLTEWEIIKSRVEKAAQADFVISLYNPKSRGRTTQIIKTREIMLKYKSSKTPVAILRNIGREKEEYILTDLEEFLNYEIDMFTIIVIGNSNTYISNGKMITPRGYKL